MSSGSFGVRQHHKTQSKLARGQYSKTSMFMSERGGPFTTNSFNWLVKRAGRKAKLPFQAHARILRHACGYALANAGHDTRSLQDYRRKNRTLSGQH